MRRFFFVLGLVATLSVDASAEKLTLEQIMADPDWIGNGPERPYWADDGESFFFYVKVDGEDRRELYEMSLDGDHYRVYDAEKMGERMADMSVSGGDWTRDRKQKVFVREGDLYLRALPSDKTKQITRTDANESRPRFMADDRRIQYRSGNRIFVFDPAGPTTSEPFVIKAEDDPAKEEDKEDYLRDQQLRLFDVIRQDKEHKDAARDRDRAERLADPSRVLPPFYLGADAEILGADLSPSGAYALVRTVSKSKNKDGKSGSMPNYVTATGYVESEEVRERVGTADRPSETLHLIDIQAHEIREIDLSVLPDIAEDRFDFLNDESQEESAEGDPDSDEEPKPRPVRVSSMGWSDNGERLVMDLVSRDNKDRWIAAVDLAQAELVPLFHEYDEAWINWRRADTGWLPDNDTVYFVSEADGYAHLYTYSFTDGYTRQRTDGEWEVSSVSATRDGASFYFIANREHPGIYNVYRLDAAANEPVRVTELSGLLQYALSPDESQLLLRHSTTTQPYELYLQTAQPGASAERMTHTVSNAFRAIDWVEPQVVQIPSSHIDRPIYSRLYLPDDTSNGTRPAVVFIHGAGYLQNAHQGWSNYFREFMFHSLLAQEGYVVLDMDYRASAGYGRDWRTAIYRRMGGPELADLEDGVNWLVANHNVDPDRVGVYGGSYGGFLTLMALFKKPHLFACGAALRPVTDWAHYNHPYTSNILNIPSLDPDAFERSSPIEFAEGLSAPLLIAHGMQDANVFYQDSVRLAQRLIELEKENWEFASYPIEGHGFTEPSSWLDEYRRIYQLFQGNLKGE